MVKNMTLGRSLVFFVASLVILCYAIGLVLDTTDWSLVT